ncbi:MAG: GNAT family N-acetyltransferase [Lewinellaceae bacterium]|nr:GNAT family N-acetyltransferase [Lewinellaceae bacterium]
MIQRATTDNLDEIRALFRETVLTATAQAYDEHQRLAWASGWAGQARWEQRLREQYFLVTKQKGQLVGFASIRPDGYLDVLYVHRDFQRQGIARKLYEELEAEARRSGVAWLETDASITARPFFEKMGFAVLAEQQKAISAVVLTNYRMRKTLL